MGARLLLHHPGFREWSTSEEGWCCDAVTAQIADYLDTLGENLRLDRNDWMALLELCLGAEPGLGDINLGRSDHAPWPSFIEEMGIGRGVPSLGTICARTVAREPGTFP